MTSLRRALADYHGFLFDLDGTLYDEGIYLRAAYRDIAALASKRFGFDADLMAQRLWRDFQENGRHRLFDRLCVEFDLPRSFIAEMLDRLRAVEIPEGLDVFPWVERWLTWIAGSGRKFVIVTNGNPIQQRNKQKHIRSACFSLASGFVCANEFLPKPEPAALLVAARLMSAPVESLVMIGDSATDELAARKAGIDFVPATELRLHAPPSLFLKTNRPL